MAASRERPGEGARRVVARDERAAVQNALEVAGKVPAILDVASGNGRWTEVLARRRGAAVVHLDLSSEHLVTARGAVQGTDGVVARGGDEGLDGKNHRYVCGDAGALPFRTQAFDLVICLEFLPYIRRVGARIRALKEMRRVSRRWVVVEYRHCEGLRFGWQRMRGRLGLEARFPRNHFSYGQIDEELRRAGLGVRKVFPIGGRASRSCVVLAEAPSAAWMNDS